MSLFPVKPVPAPVNGVEIEVCNKCFGTGAFCLGLLNNKPYSNTGFTCYQCKGAGYISKKKQEKIVVLLFEKDELIGVETNGKKRSPKKVLSRNEALAAIKDAGYKTSTWNKNSTTFIK